MKPTLPSYIICLLAILLLTTCKKSTTTTTVATGSMSYKVDGVLTKMDIASGITLGITKLQGVGYDSELLVTGSAATITYPELSIGLLNLRNGTYDLSTTKGVINIVFYTATGNQNTFTATSGQLVVSAFDGNTISGTFQCVVTNSSGTSVITKNITEGVFNCPVTPGI